MPPFLELSAKNFRNLKDYNKLVPSSNTNLVLGENGAGKTNFLEAIYLNALGRSFRTSALSNLIRKEASDCLVFSVFSNETQLGLEHPKTGQHKIGLQRLRGNKQKIKIDNEVLPSVAPLARLVPILAIQPTETQLVDGGGALRRKYLDWIMFHVEQNFLQSWKNHQRLLKHRNHLLRGLGRSSGASFKNLQSELLAWDRQFVEANEQIRMLREPVFESLFGRVEAMLGDIPAMSKAGISIEGDFFSGWQKGEAFETLLKEGLEQDIKKGFSKIGAHRADIRLKANGSPAKEFLSSGQKKLLAMAMKLAQAQELKEACNKKAVLVVDDMFAELDQANAKAFIGLIEDLDTQAFFSCVEADKNAIKLFSRTPKVFHVEQGEIKGK
jgi:DNA replication and repair protein RecF